MRLFTLKEVLCFLNQRISNFAGVHFQFTVTNRRFQRFDAFHIDIVGARLHQFGLRIT
ncbi:hypothetical protein D3C84_1203790 [compost metagenome]